MSLSRGAPDRAYRIGEVASLTGLTVETLRYYEREGLLRSARSPGGARRFGQEVVGRVRFIKQAQAVGLTLRDIQELVRFREGASQIACQRIRKVLAERIADVDSRVRQLRNFRALLQQHLEACDQALRGQPDPQCPALDALEHANVAGRPGAGK